MKKLFIFYGVIFILGAECMDCKCSTAIDPVKQDVLMGKVPSSKDDAIKYEKMYELDHNDSIGLQAGILAAKYFIDQKDIEKASNLLVTMLPVVFSLMATDFFWYFTTKIVCSDALISKYSEKKSITVTDVESILKRGN